MSRTHVPADLRRLVRERARDCCEYCGLPEDFSFASHEVEHIIALKHRGETEPENLALACTLCNKHKGSDLVSIDPDSKELVPLFHPRQQAWTDHFRLLHSGEIEARTLTGRVTVMLLQLSRRERIEERQLLIEAGVLKV